MGAAPRSSCSSWTATESECPMARSARIDRPRSRPMWPVPGSSPTRRGNVSRSCCRANARGSSPCSEDALRRYIDALGRGEPDYHEMTPEVAAQTRQQLLLNQAILAKLGELRAMSFRGVTPLGNDLYMVHFANGSAEWRIGL